MRRVAGFEGMRVDADVIVVGSGLSGLVVAAELADHGRRVTIVDQESEERIGGQAHWSFGGLFLVDTPEQRRLGIRDSYELALDDWFASAEFEEHDVWPRRWAEAYVEQAAGDLRSWLRGMGVRLFPAVQWAERGGYNATGPGSSVPRFHIVWGTGPGILAPFISRVRRAEDEGRINLRFRHRVEDFTETGGSVDGVQGRNLETDEEFTLRAQAVVVAAGGIGGNPDLVRRFWPEERYGPPPEDMLQGVPDHVDGSMLELVERSGGSILNSGRMWSYPEGIPHHTPVWSRHAVRILAGPSSMWLDATGRRLPPPLFPVYDTLAALEHILKTGHGHSWFVLNHRMASDEFSLSGSVHNPDLTNKSIQLLLKRVTPGPSEPLQNFFDRVPDIVQADKLGELVAKMNALTGLGLVDEETLRREVIARDRQIALGYHNDAQLAAIDAARRFRTDRVTRISSSARILDPSAGPLLAVRLRILTRKTLGGIETDLGARVLRPGGDPMPGVYAVGEVAGFGGGGMHGRRSMEGTFLGGCLVSGRLAARDLSQRLT